MLPPRNIALGLQAKRPTPKRLYCSARNKNRKRPVLCSRVRPASWRCCVIQVTVDALELESPSSLLYLSNCTRAGSSRIFYIAKVANVCDSVFYPHWNGPCCATPSTCTARPRAAEIAALAAGCVPIRPSFHAPTDLHQWGVN